LQVRRLPELHFTLDNSEEGALRIEQTAQGSKKGQADRIVTPASGTGFPYEVVACFSILESKT